MYLLDETVVTSASDLTTASKCEFAFLRALDARLGRIERVEEAPDAMLARAATLGDQHELRVLEAFRRQFGDGVVEIARPDGRARDELEAAASDTVQAFAGRADVVFQATFFDGSFVGYADFIVHVGDGVYEVQDTKLARSAKVTALLQLAAYGEQLQRIGVQTAETVRLVLGDGSESVHRLRDILPVYRNRRDRLQRIIAERMAASEAVGWGDARYTVCGRCDTCTAEVEATRDVLQVAGMRLTQRARLADAGITTIDQLAESTNEVPGIAQSTLATLRRQAALQTVPHDAAHPPAIDLFDAQALAALPAPDAGDLFFDFEGDPLYTEGDATRWGLDYLFGVLDANEGFTAFWAHDFAEERVALREFLDFVAHRRAKHPNLHIYHYAPYEKTHLLSIAARYGEGEEEVDALLRDHVLVDLYPLVRKSLRVGSPSYSLKKLEPLYMGQTLRQGDVQTAGESIEEYANARRMQLAGQQVEGQRMLDQIADYNEYDCLSTLRLRDWLLSLAAERGVYPGTPAEQPDELEPFTPSPLHDDLMALAGDPLDAERTADSVALALAAAAIDYHRRENKSFWWEHFSRLIQPIADWEETRDVFVVERGSVERDWFKEGRQRSLRRIIRVSGRLAPGSSLKAGSEVHALYEHPAPFRNNKAEYGARSWRPAKIEDAFDDGSFLVVETLPADTEEWVEVPSALTPGPPPRAGNLQAAIAEWGQGIVDAAPEWPANAVVDILRRTPPRLWAGAGAVRSGMVSSGSGSSASGSSASGHSGMVSPGSVSSGLVRSGDTIADVVSSILALDDSYLAVQGPPGTGKTYLASHVITTLVRDHGWKIGVVAQSHSVVENVLEKVVQAGLPAELVGKEPKRDDPTFTALRKDGQAAFIAAHPTGFVLGGTAWDFSNLTRVARRELDLLVVDEAGQFSLGNTIAVGVAARNLLLLGDPQQLPQVSQGTHPERIDDSALGWISEGHDVLPPDLGYFLAESRRMHDAVTAPVSELSYEGALRSHPCTGERMLDGVNPGLTIVPVSHADNATSSAEEAERVVELARDLIGRAWTDPSCGRHTDALGAADIIVVTPYNAQVTLVREHLDAASLDGVRVGTVDKFQGQEAVVAIVTLAASSPAEVPRGMPFLILKNRLNVAISRAQWAAYLLYSPALTDYLPTSASEVAQLSAFITLVSPD